jgi:hypothetical protein
MNRNWRHAAQETVQANRYVPLPDQVRSVVAVDHPLDGPSVFWNYDEHSTYVVLSQRGLRRQNYVDVGRYKVYGDGEDGQVRIRPPDRLTEVLASNFQEGSRVMYLAYDEMVEGDNSAVYLLSTGQLLDLLPSGASESVAGDGGTDLREAILRNPGFLPAP